MEAEGEGEPMDEDTAEILDQQTQPSDKPRITTRYMTKYERARILGTRGTADQVFLFSSVPVTPCLAALHS